MVIAPPPPPYSPGGGAPPSHPPPSPPPPKLPPPPAPPPEAVLRLWYHHISSNGANNLQMSTSVPLARLTMANLGGTMDVHQCCVVCNSMQPPSSPPPPVAATSAHAKLVRDDQQPRVRARHWTAATGGRTLCIASRTALDCCTAQVSRRMTRSTARARATIPSPSRSSGGKGCRTRLLSRPSPARVRVSVCNPCQQRTARLSASCTLAFGNLPRATRTWQTTLPRVAARPTTNLTQAHGRRRSSGTDFVARALPRRSPPAPTTRTTRSSATTQQSAETIA